MTSSLLDSLQLTIVAMGIVFVALYALSLLMSALPNVVGREKKAATPKPQAPVATTPQPESVQLASDDSNADSVETIAVIASAIAAYLGQAPEGLNIIAIRRIGSGLSPWALSVRRESVQN